MPGTRTEWRTDVIAARGVPPQNRVTRADVAGTHLDQVVDFSDYAAQWGKTFWVDVWAPGANTSGISTSGGVQRFQLVLP